MRRDRGSKSGKESWGGRSGGGAGNEGVRSIAPLGSDIITRSSPGRPPRLCPCLGNGKSHQRYEVSHSAVGRRAGKSRRRRKEGRGAELKKKIIIIKKEEGEQGQDALCLLGAGSIAVLNISHVEIHWQWREKGTDVPELRENLRPPCQWIQ